MNQKKNTLKTGSLFGNSHKRGKAIIQHGGWGIGEINRKLRVTRTNIIAVILLCILLLASIGFALANETALFTNKEGNASLEPLDSKIGMDVSSASLNKQAAGETEFASGEFLVKFNAVSMSSIGSTLESLNATVLRSYQMLGIYLVRLNEQPTTMKAALALLEDNAQVAYAEPNYIRKVCNTPNDPFFSNQWALQNTGQLNGSAGADISATGAWDVTTGSRDIVVAVIDTGVDYNHPDLAANMWRNPGEIPGNGVDDDGNGYVDDVYGIDTVNHDSDPIDDYGHGTHCAGIIGAVGNNSLGVTGVNWNVTIMALKMFNSLGSGTDADAIECINYALVMKVFYGVNVRILSNSWGGGGYDQALYDVIDVAGLFDVLFVASACNDAVNNDVSLVYPASYDLSNIISVASTDKFDHLSSFSNWGPKTVDVGAPGGKIFSTMPTYHVGLTDRGYPLNYGYMNGTSMACPQVAGLAALILASNAGLSTVQVKTRILATVDTVPALTGKVLTDGRINASRALTTTDTSMHSKIIEPAVNGELVRSAQLSVSVWLYTTTDPILGADVHATFSTGEPSLTLRDDGIAPDEFMSDGIYTASYSPSVTGNLTLQVNAWARGYTPASASVTANVRNVLDYRISGTPYQWIEISGSSIGLCLGDEGSTTLVSPFPLSFYGTSYLNLTIGTNGNINFENKLLDYDNTPIPSPNYNGVHGFIAVFWDDLNMRTSIDSGAVYCGVFGSSPNRYLIVEWKDVPHYLNVGSVTFEAIFYENSSDIVFQYKDVYFENIFVDLGSSATIGMQFNEYWGTEYAYDMVSVINNYALRFTAVNNDYSVYRVASQIMQEPTLSAYYVRTGDILDYSGLGFVYGRSANTQNIISQSDALYINQTTGSPLFAGDIVAFGGKFANILTRYYENQEISRVWLDQNSTHFLFSSGTINQVVYAVEKSTYIPSVKDYFIIQAFNDDNDRAVLLIWGLNGQGTCAGGQCFADILWPHIADFNMNYYIYSWEDLNGDGMQTTNELSLVTSGI